MQEETADVELCINILPDGYIDWVEYGKTMVQKHQRWLERLEIKEAENDPENQ